MYMQNHLFTQQRGRPGYSGFRGVLAAMLLGVLLFATGAKATGLNGIYTIDASGSGNYTTFKAAVADLVNYGVSGPVTFNVTATTYNEAVSVPSITGTTATNTITFTGKGRANTTLGGVSGVVVTFKAYTNFTNMNIVSTGGSVIQANGSNSCGIYNCNITGATSTSSYLISASPALSLTIAYCECYGGGIGVYSQGTTTGSAAAGLMRLSHNRFVEQGEYGIYFYYDYKDSIAYNTIDSSSSSSYYEAFYSIYANGFIIWGNKVLVSCQWSYFFELQDYQQVAGHPTFSQLVNNWFVSNSGNSGVYGCGEDIAEYATNYLVEYNSFVNLAGVDYTLLFEPIYATGLQFINNIMYNAVSNSYNAYMIDEYTSFGTYDGNDYCGTGTQTILIYPGGTTNYSYSSVSAYVSGMASFGLDQHAMGVTPPFVSLSYPQDLHMSTTKAAPNKGIAGTTVTTDIDAKGRFPTPTSGASESYYGIVNNNAGVTALISPVAACPGTATVSVTVANLGLNAISSVGPNTIAWTWNGVAQPAVTYTTAIALYGSATITLGTVTMVSGVSNTVKVWPTKTNGVNNAGGSTGRYLYHRWYQTYRRQEL